MKPFVPVLTAAALVAVLTACGGGSDDTADVDAGDAAGTAGTVETVDTAGTSAADVPASSEPSDDGSTASFEPGEIAFRVVNTLDEPVDIYVRTTGLVEAFPVEEAVAPGSVTELVAPPPGGTFVVTEAGGGDPTCVVTCDHFIAALTATSEEGPVRTLILYEDPFDGPKAFDLWEHPDASRLGNANAMPAPDPSAGVMVVTAIGVTGADFGLRLAMDGSAGCVEPFNLENILVGGNQTPAFTYEGDAADIVLHDNTDRECAEAPVGGPFTVDGGPGTRSHVILLGSPGSLDAIVVPMADGAGGGSGGDDSASSGDDRDLAVELLAAQVATELGLDAEQAACTAGLMVDAIGADVLLYEGDLVELETLPAESTEAGSEALVQAVTDCGVDPAVFGG